MRSLKANRDNLHVLDVAYMGAFKSPDGEKILADLKKHFYPDRLFTDDPHTTAIRNGQADVIRYILRRIDNGVDGQSIR